jgi:heme exporter protein C
MEQFVARLARPAGAVALLLGIVLAWAVVFYVPAEKVQGVIQKIMYLHVPAAIIAYMACGVVAVAGGLYLFQGKRSWDRIARCSAEIAVLLCTIVLLTGALWGKVIWGAPWVWDARLTSFLILWLVYVSYFVLRRLVEGEQGARFAAMLGIIGVLDIPFINIAAEKFRTLHPPNVMKGGMTREMGVTLTLGIFAMLAFYVYLLATRVDMQRLSDRVHAMRDQLEGR